MKRELLVHPVGYCILLLGLLVAVLFTFAVWPDPVLMRLGFAALGIGYFGWGIAVHTKLHDLTQRIVLEYLGIAAVAVALLWLVTV